MNQQPFVPASHAGPADIGTCRETPETAAYPLARHVLAFILSPLLVLSGTSSTVSAQLTVQPAEAAAPVEQFADPPGRVGWLGHIDGQVSFSDGGAPAQDRAGWTAAVPNRPLTSGDRLWTARGARSELHIGSTAVRMDGETRLDLVQLDDDTTSLDLPQGTLNVRVRTLFDGQRLELRTPNLVFVVQQPGEYRLDAIPPAT